MPKTIWNSHQFFAPRTSSSCIYCLNTRKDSTLTVQSRNQKKDNKVVNHCKIRETKNIWRKTQASAISSSQNPTIKKRDLWIIEKHAAISSHQMGWKLSVMHLRNTTFLRKKPLILSFWINLRQITKPYSNSSINWTELEATIRRIHSSWLKASKYQKTQRQTKEILCRSIKLQLRILK